VLFNLLFFLQIYVVIIKNFILNINYHYHILSYQTDFHTLFLFVTFASCFSPENATQNTPW